MSVRLDEFFQCRSQHAKTPMNTALIIGSGPAAAGAALALSRSPGLKITVVDVGLRLEADRQNVVDTLAAQDPGQWDHRLVQRISAQPIGSRIRGVPEKRIYGSNYPFRDVAQLEGLTPTGSVTKSVISAAYGGFSGVWGSQLMPFTPSVFATWPVRASEIQPHYEAILREIPFAGEEDDLADHFPLMGCPTPLPEMSVRSKWVLEAYARHRPALNDMGITMGKARLAFEAARCVRCGLCMTGCPYGLIYSASQTFDALRRANRVTYHDGLMALEVSEESDKAVVIAKQLGTGRMHRFEADRVYVACGAIGTTRLVANSLGLFDVQLAMGESQQFALPMLSLRPTDDPRREAAFTLNQFNMVVALDQSGVDISQLHFYTFNSAFLDALPSPLRADSAEYARRQLLRRLSVVLGYLPSWRSPRLLVRVRRAASGEDLPKLQLSRETPPPGRKQMLRVVLTRLARSSRLLDLYPMLPMLRLAAGGKSYHFGGSFPHIESGSTRFGSDRLGRVASWRRVHLVDASVFPNVPAMTFTLTIMANAHRIASESLELV
jgi:choline dehydrogenase-like flavoprotein